MNKMQTNDLIALSFLIDDEIYLTKDEQKNIAIEDKILPNQKEEEIVAIEELPLKEIKEEVKEEIKIPDTISTPQTDFKYLGENNKYILIIVKEPEADFLKSVDLTFLLKILSAKKLTLDDVAIINTEKNEALDFDSLKNFFACTKIITFGINPKSLQIDTAVANKISIFKNTPILGTWDLPKLQADTSKKTIFWNELKTF